MSYKNCTITLISLDGCSCELEDTLPGTVFDSVSFDSLLSQIANCLKPESTSCTIVAELRYDGFQGLRFTMSVDVAMTSGRTLAERMEKLANFWVSPQGVEFSSRTHLPASTLHKLYRQHSLVLFESNRRALLAASGATPLKS